MSFSVCRVEWSIAETLLRNVREKVFICEWRIPKKIEFDNDDSNAYHMLVCDDLIQEPVATGRIMPNGDISRIAVLMSHRKNDLDKIVLKGLFNVAKELNLNEIFINSPLDHVDYFKKNHFYNIGSVFMEAGMPRQRMACPVKFNNISKVYLSH